MAGGRLLDDPRRARSGLTARRRVANAIQRRLPALIFRAVAPDTHADEPRTDTAADEGNAADRPGFVEPSMSVGATTCELETSAAWQTDRTRHARDAEPSTPSLLRIDIGARRAFSGASGWQAFRAYLASFGRLRFWARVSISQ
jgi:hypothetical protein